MFALLATVIAIDAVSRWLSELCAWLLSADRHRAPSIPPAPIAFTVSRLPTVSTSTDCLRNPSPRLAADKRSSAGLVIKPATTTTGIIASGGSTNIPPSIAMTASVMMTKGTSMIAVSVADAKKSRSVSSSRIRPVSVPVDPGRRSSRIDSSLANSVSPTS